MKTAICKFCGKSISKNSIRCKSCSNISRKGKYKISKQGKINISNSLKGKIPWNKGIPMSEIQKQKISNNKDRANKIRLSKLNKKRKTFSKGWRRNLSNACIKNSKFKGENNPNWRGGIMKGKPIFISRYHGLRSYEWNLLRKKVIELNGKKCIICDSLVEIPIVDHIIPYRISFDNSLKNLQILCRSCHAKKDLTW